MIVLPYVRETTIPECKVVMTSKNPIQSVYSLPGDKYIVHFEKSKQVALFTCSELYYSPSCNQTLLFGDENGQFFGNLAIASDVV